MVFRFLRLKVKWREIGKIHNASCCRMSFGRKYALTECSFRTVQWACRRQSQKLRCCTRKCFLWREKPTVELMLVIIAYKFLFADRVWMRWLPRLSFFGHWRNLEINIKSRPNWKENRNTRSFRSETIPTILRFRLFEMIVSSTTPNSKNNPPSSNSEIWPTVSVFSLGSSTDEKFWPISRIWLKELIEKDNFFAI